MKPTTRAEYLDNLKRHPVWKLLASTNASDTITLLQCNLYDKDRVLPSSILHERVNNSLEEFRVHGRQVPEHLDARHYISNWVTDGWLERRLPTDSPEEVYELSTSAIDVIRFVGNIENPHSTATESRLTLVMQALDTLAADTDVDRSRRVERLRAERDRIQKEIEAVERGQIRLLPMEAALERLREIISLAADITEDFRRVRERFDQLNRALRQQIMESEGSRAEVLEKMFEGIDLIAASDAGRSFAAFYRLLNDPEQSALMEEAIDGIVEREFFQTVTSEDKKFLLGFTRRLLNQSGDVHQVMQHLARSLKGFVQSQEYSRQRHLNRTLKDAQRLAYDLRGRFRPWDKIPFELGLSFAKVQSVAQYTLFDPTLAARAAPMTEGVPVNVSLDSISEMIAFSDIDLRALEEAVDASLMRRNPVSIGGVLEFFPPHQGLGSVIGLIEIGSRIGHAVPAPATEMVCWIGMDDLSRTASIPLIYFSKGDSDA